ncbi:FAD-dependent oxidoreductase [Aspergillus foveolatus]|uniref:FAD-dependent oxidoreductase n=1 Tax=Aspergillus foveolatus TaxID=210207 RepID=UPI003CCCF033
MNNNSLALKVIIIGGSVAGLTLAHCLDHAGIDYLVLEKHEDIQANIGGSIGLMANGCRILDQLGIYRILEQYTSPISVSHMAFPDGYTRSDLFPTRLLQRFGYPVSILTRRQLLHVLSTSLRDVSKIRTATKVVRIQPSENPEAPITVYAEDGQHYSGDVVVGADGVYSLTRSEISRLAYGHHSVEARSAKQANLPHDMTIQYMCIFGISQPVHSIPRGAQIVRCYDNLTLLIFPAREDTIPWFAIMRFYSPYTTGERLKWSREEIKARAESMAHLQIWKEVRFGDLWRRTPTVSSTPLHEGLSEAWISNCMVCIGDSVSKLTPNIAQGANLAIESAASLANVLYQVRDMHKPSAMAVQDCLEQYVRNHRRRLRGIHAFSRFVTRVQSRQGYFLPLFSRYLYPWSGDATFFLLADIIAGAVALDYIPLPQRSGGKWESPGRAIARRTILTLILVLGAFATNYIFERQKAQPAMVE